MILTDDFSAHGEDAGVGFGGFGVGDVAEADVDLGQGGPGEEVVGLEGGCLKGSAEGFFELVGFQQDHGEGVPGVEVIGIEFDAFSVEGRGFFEFAEGEVAAGIIEEGLDGFAQNGFGVSAGRCRERLICD